MFKMKRLRYEGSGHRTRKEGDSYHFSVEQCFDKSATRALMFVGIDSIGRIILVWSLGVDGALKVAETLDCSR
jgi:hypothetical protein